jgi:hypothetical protein
MDEHELTALIEAERPAPDLVFVAELDKRVREGFPRKRRVDRLRRALAVRTPRPPVALLGGAASLLLALVVAVSLLGNDDGTPRTVTEMPGAAIEDSGGRSIAPVAPGEPAPPSLPSAATRERSLLAPPIRRGRGFAPGRRERLVQRSASLTLAAPDDRLDRVAADVARVTDRYRGFVLSSSLSTGDEGAVTGGTFQLRIPAARLQPALADLAELGQVRSRTQAGEDVTAAFVTAGDRLQAARVERRSLLTRLEQADTDVEAESLRLQLDANAGEVNRLRGQIRRLRVSTDYATVSVALEADDGEAVPPGDGLGGAVDDALDSLGDSLELAIRALGVLTPLALLAIVASLAGRALLRRRRESALS